MEEGPEPQEWVERAAEEHHHAHAHEHAEAAHSGPTPAAITAAILAVMAAIGSLLSGHAANQAILAQSQATDQWAFYQAKGTKGHIYEVAGELIHVLGQPENERSKPALDKFRDQAKRYDGEKEEIQRHAEALEEESRHELHRHHRYALGVSLFQVGIVLASVSILVRYRALYILSLVAGAVGLVFVALGLAG